MCIKAEADGESSARYTTAEATAKAQTEGSSLSSLEYVSGKTRYWDDAFGRKSKLTIYAFAIPGKSDGTLPSWDATEWTVVDATTNPNWYTGTEQTSFTLSVSTSQTSETMGNEDITYSNNVSSGGKGGRYTYSYDATDKEDWVENKFADGQLVWTPKTNTTGETTGKFDKGHLVFKHALAWIEINLKEGAGYDHSKATDFLWTKNKTSEDVKQNITLTGLNTSGTFNVATGVWTGQTSSDITLLNETTGSAAVQTTRQLNAYVLPGTDLMNTTSNVVEFEIDNSKYYVTGKQIAEAVRKYYTEGAGKPASGTSPYASFETIEAGKHYVINLTVAKKGIDDITAAIVDWETVNSSDADAKNTYVNFSLKSAGTAVTDGNSFNLYRATQTAANYIDGQTAPNYNWSTGYGDAATKNYGSSVWNTDWYWENNLTYYHFRAANVDKSSITTDANGDYFTIKSDSVTSSNYKDYLWGAPFTASGKIAYSTTSGFDNETTTGEGDNKTTTHQISSAIGATDNQINMLMLHMTSKIIVNVSTTTDASKLTLFDNKGTDDTPDDQTTKVEILNFLPDGKVLMGNGLVSTQSTSRTASATMSAGTYTPATEEAAAQMGNFQYSMVPQALSWEGGTIGLRITTPDGNQYLVRDLSTCTAAVSNHTLSNPYSAASGSLYKINAWYPGFSYTYNIIIKKTGVDNITAAVVGWETVTGSNINIDLEN